MSTSSSGSSPELEIIWGHFKVSQKQADADGMTAALMAFDVEYDNTKADLPRYAPQKQMARRGTMVRAIAKQQKLDAEEAFKFSFDQREPDSDTEGSW